MADTPNHEYNVPDQGDQDWHNPLNENFEAFDSDIELRDEESELSTYTPAAGAKFLSTDTGVVYVGDGSDWTAAFVHPAYDPSTGEAQFDQTVSTPGLTGALTGGDELTDIAGNNLTISNGQLDASTGGGGGGGGGISSLSGGDGVAVTLQGLVTGGQELSTIAGTNLSIDSNGQLNASGGGGGGGGGISSLSGGDGVDPASISDGDTLSVAWGDANDLDSDGNVTTGGGGGEWQQNGSLLEPSDSSIDGVDVDELHAPLLDAGTGPLEVTVGGARVLRVTAEDSGDAGNVVAGHSSNVVSSGVIGATIAGGGLHGGGNLQPNSVTGEYGTVGGGFGNRADESGTVGGGSANRASNLGATVAGGRKNLAAGQASSVGGGESNDADDDDATVAGGRENTAGFVKTTVGGGFDNTADGRGATIAGGTLNVASGLKTSIGGGSSNEVTADYATIGGGRHNNAAGEYATIAGGGPTDESNAQATQNYVSGDYGTIGGGGDNSVTAASGTVGGGRRNEVSNGFATVGGGDQNKATGARATVAGGHINEATGPVATVAGGGNNEASDYLATVGGGERNEASGYRATVAGGIKNVASAESATVGGGYLNQAEADGATIAGGAPTGDNFPEDTNNVVYDDYGTVGGGGNNQAGSDDDDPTTAQFATIPGGRDNQASGNYSFAAGRNATASHDGSFVVGDSSSDGIVSVASDEARFQGSIRSSRLTTESDGIWHYSDSQSTTADWRTVYAPGNDEWRVEQWDPDSGLGAWIRKMWVTAGGDVEAQGAKNFVETVDTDDGEKEVVYTASESGTAHTEESGVAELDDGRVEIDLPEHFTWVTSEDDPLHVQTTPYSADSAGLAVVERSTEHLVVEDLDGEGDYEFSYTVRGTRDGYEDKQVVREPSEATATESASPADD
ncbi:hypothetical protein BRC73_03045 [Halobacteriales archaeon QH_7_66_37]|nr:MAG: hypothetical protein BRC73_03045 [Halobacteriales archaeon QH_7_66_37]